MAPASLQISLNGEATYVGRLTWQQAAVARDVVNTWRLHVRNRQVTSWHVGVLNPSRLHWRRGVEALLSPATRSLQTRRPSCTSRVRDTARIPR